MSAELGIMCELVPYANMENKCALKIKNAKVFLSVSPVC